jgi:hypothetical protein
MVDIEPALVAFWGRFRDGSLGGYDDSSSTGEKGSKLLIRSVISSLMIPLIMIPL